MFTVRPWRMEWELVRWIALVIVAAGLALLATRAASGADLEQPREPQLLPASAVELAKPMLTEQFAPDELNTQLWKILSQQQAGLPEEALAGWEQVTLPYETRAWQHIAMAVANLQLRKLDAAADQLDLAAQLEPHNPLVHYYTAILRLDQASHAKDWYDAIGPTKVRLAAYRPREITPNTRSMYELHAMQEFEQSIGNANYIDRGLALAPVGYQGFTMLPAVTVNDLLVAVGAERFEGQAHNMLGAMCLDRAAYEQAEEHMDAAAAAGLTVVFGYSDLGAAYQHEERFDDAFRVYLKSIGHEPGFVRPLRHALENAGRAILDR